MQIEYLNPGDLSNVLSSEDVNLWLEMLADSYVPGEEATGAYGENPYGYFSLFAAYDGNEKNDDGFVYPGTPEFITVPAAEAMEVWLERLEAGEFTIIAQHSPYEDYIDAYGTSVMQDIVSTASNDTNNVVVSYTHEEATTFDGETVDFLYNATYSNAEVSGLRSRFGYESGFGLEDQLASDLEAIGTEVYNAYMSKRMTYDKTNDLNLPRRVFAELIPLARRTSSSTRSGTAVTPGSLSSIDVDRTY
tara:strand:+ start:11112 stop:11855 length:744 start_codon:yes stop_codon:yes gene_type:complete